MERKYTILAILLIVLAFGLVVLPGKKEIRETDPRVILASITEKSRYLSADLITHRIIENDPSLMLIDLRPADQFKAFALPKALNIQPDSLLTASTLELLNQPGKDKVLYANSDLMAEKAWLICTRHSLDRIYILKGGLNEWYNTIIKPGIVSNTASTADLDLLNFRMAARQFFTGAQQTPVKTSPKKIPQKVNFVRKEPAAASGGGC